MKFLLLISTILHLLTVCDSYSQPPLPPNPSAPINRAFDIAPNNIRFEWSASVNAMYYHIQISRNPSFSGLLDAEQTLLTQTAYTFVTSVINNPPEAKADYYWRISAGNDYGEGAWSDVQKFTTGFPEGQAIVMRFFDADTALAMIALNSRDYFDARLLYSKVKTLRRDTTALYRQEDFPYLYIEPFTVRRIDFLRAGGSSILGHIQFDYRFADVPPFGPRTDLLLYFHRKLAVPKLRYPKWNYYSENEIPVTALIPPSGQIKFIDSSKTPILLIHGAGYTSWGNTPTELTAAGYDVWQWLYPADAPIDTSAALLADAIKRLGAIYGAKKIGVAAHGTGGLVVRSYIQGPLNSGNIGKLLMLGAPNHGSYFAFKLAYTQEFTETSGDYVRRLDRNAPLWRDVSPGSETLKRLNSVRLPALSASGIDPASTYLCVAGTTDMNLGWPHNEVAGFDDGISAMESVSLLDQNLPLATIAMANMPNGANKNLLENSGIIITEFMRETYSPRPPSQQLLSVLESFTVQFGYVAKPDNHLFDSPAIEIWTIPTLTAPRLSVVREKSIPNLTIIPEGDALETETRYGMLQNPSSGRYFSVSRNGDGGIGWDFINQNHAVRFADYIYFPIDKKQTARRRRAIPISAEPLSVRLMPMQTSERTIKFKSTITGAWLKGADRRHEMHIFPETDKTSSRDTISFKIDPYMDTILVIATPIDNTAPLQSSASASFNLIAPNGMSFEAAKGNDTTVPQYTAGGVEKFTADGAAYFYMARPMAGIWKIACNTAVQPLRFTASFLSDLSLRIVADDSVFSAGDSVQFAVVLPNFFFNDLKVSASLYLDANPDSSTLGIPLDLVRDRFNPAIYRGVFVPRANGMFYIRADFSAQFPESRISRTAFHAIEVADALPDRPKLIFPPRLMTDVPRNTFLSWKHDVLARSYRVQVARDFRFDTLLTDNSTVFDTTIALIELAPTTTYYWRVQAKNARGTTIWSEVYWFSTGGKALGGTQLISPKNGTIAIRPDTIFQWGAVTGAPLYQFQITKDSLFYASALDTFVFGSQVKFSLENSTRYYWRVRALTGTGERGPWSEEWRIRRLVPAPELYLPHNKAEGLPIEMTFVWAPPIAGLKYHLQLSYYPDFKSLILDKQDITDSTFTTLLPMSGAIYFWRVKWLLPDGASDWSVIRSFATIVATPRQDSPGNGVIGVNLNPTISWNSVTNATYYHLQVSNEPDFITPDFNDSTINAVSRPLKNLEPLTRYFWRVRTIAPAGKSPWSEIWEFVTGENPNGVAEELQTYQMQLHPNPASDILWMVIPQELNTQTGATTVLIDFFDALGLPIRRIRADIASQTMTIPLRVSELPSGIYRVQIRILEKIISKNIIITH